MVARGWWLLLVVGAAACAQAPPAADPATAKRIEDAQGLLDRGEARAAAGQYQAALLTLGEARRAAGDAAPWIVMRSWLAEGRLRARLGDPNGAQTALLKAAELTIVPDGHPDWPERPEILYRLGEARASLGRGKEARLAWQEVIDKSPHSPGRIDAERALAMLEAREGDPAGADKRLDAWLAAYPWSAEAPWLLHAAGQAFADRGQHEAAARRLDQLRRDWPQSENAWSARELLVDCRRQLKQYDQALALVGEVIGTRPELVMVADATGVKVDLLEAKGETAGAVAALDELAGRYPETWIAHRARLRAAALLRAKKDLPAAIQRLEAADQAFKAPYWRLQTLRPLIECYRAAKEWDKAEDATDVLVQTTAGTALGAEAMLLKAQIQQEAGRKRAARATLDKLLATYRGAPYVPLAEQLRRAWEVAG
jgi:TolA-binding protein